MKIPFLTAIAVVTLTGCLLRFVALESSPPGFYVDEAAGATNIICLSQNGTNESGIAHPLFFPQFGAFFSPTYIYFGALWTKIFGISIFSFRAVAAFFSVLAIWGLFLLAEIFIGGEGAWFVALAASISPWAFQFSRIAWDPPLMICFLIWAIYAFFRSPRARDAVIAGLLMSAAAYTYPPSRAQIPLLIVGMLWLKRKTQGLSLRFAGFFASSLFLASLPLIYLTLSGQIQGRFRMLSVFSAYPGIAGLAAFIGNVFRHMGPLFLFFTGDHNLRHSTGRFGELSWLDLLALVLSLLFLASQLPKVKSKLSTPPGRLCLFALIGFFAGIIPAALTWEGIPHALRAIGAWPFVSILTGTILWRLSFVYPNLKKISLSLAAVFLLGFTWNYFSQYPTLSYLWFDTFVKEAAIQAGSTGNWDDFSRLTANYQKPSLRYYLVRYGNETCSSSSQKIDEMARKFSARK